jgi:hypothetical protein
MTNFYAVYLFIIIAIVLLGLGLWFKRGWLFLLGALCWVFASFYCFATATATTQYIYLFGVFCLAAALANIIASFTINRKPKPVPPPEISHSDAIAAKAEAVRASRGKHKMKNQSGLFG